ncbi:MAG: hypothetical protein AB1486_01765 [Planctomycetota bacterium]
MPHLTIDFGIVLIVLGLGGYLGTGTTSVTALIPAFFGIPLLALGWAARRSPAGGGGARKTLMHVACGLALLGLIGAARGLPGFVSLLSGGRVERPVAVVLQTVMVFFCIGYLVAAVRSFIAARRRVPQDA